MKYISFIFFLILSVGSYSQCNTDVSICTPGVSGPFSFVAASQEVGSCQAFINGTSSPNYAYILLNITQSGPLSLLINGDVTDGFIDVSIFNIPIGQDPCVAITDNTNEIACNYADNQDGCNEFGTYFGCSSTIPPPMVNAGDLLMIVVEDYSDFQTTFTLELGPSPNAQTGAFDASFTVNDFCIGESNSATITGVPGGVFSLNPDPSDGSTIDPITGEIFGGIVSTTYTIQYTTASECSSFQTHDITVQPIEDASFTLNDFCEGVANSALITGTTGGVFSFNPDLGDGSTINPITGEIVGGVGSTTYTIQYTTGGSCPDTQSNSVLVFPSEDASFILNDFCEGELNSASEIATPGGVFELISPLDGTIIDTSTGTLIVAVAGNTYIISYTTSGVCPATSTQSVHVNPIDHSGYTIVDFCEGSPNSATNILSSGGVFSLVTSVTDGASIDSSTGEIYNGVAGTTYTVGYTVGGICSGTLAQDITVFPVEEASFYYPNSCLGQDIIPVIEATLGGVFSFSNTVTDGASIDPITGEIIDGVAGNTYVVNYITSGFCFDTHEETITLKDSPVVNELHETCALDQLTYTVSFEIANGDPVSYVVDGDGILSGTIFTSDPISSGTQYTFSVNDANDCNPIEVTGENVCICPANAEISGEVVICNGDIGYVHVDFSGGDLPWTFTYMIDGLVEGEISTTENPYLLAVDHDGEVTLDVISDIYCDGLTSGLAQVDELDVPTAAISGSESICNGEETLFTIELSGSAPWEVVYAVNGISQPLVIITDSIHELVVSQAGTYTIESVSTYGCSGIGSGSAELIVHDLPQASLDGDVVICEGGSAYMTIDVSGSPSFEVNYSLDGEIQDPLFIDQNGSYDVLVDSSGVYELISISDIYCAGTALGSSNISIEPLPTAIISGDFVICDGTVQGIPIELTGTQDWIINYSINGVTQSPIETSSSSYYLTAISEGIYEIVSVSDNYCSNTGEGSSTLAFYPPIDVSFPEYNGICIGDISQLIVSASNGIGPPYTYDWATDGLISSSDTIAWYQLIESTSITLSVSDDCDYTTTVQVPITVHPTPQVDFSSVQSICGAGDVLISNTTPTEYVGADCTWVVNGDSIPGCNSTSYYFTNTGSYDVGLSVVSPYGCVGYTLIQDYIEVLPVPTADFYFSPTDATTINPIINFHNLSSDDADAYSWSFSDEGFSDEENPVFTFPVEFGPDFWSTCLEVSNSFGCEDSICRAVPIYGAVVILAPNAFTPDGDGLNELFDPVVIGADKNNYVLRIFNRQGALVFETIDIDAKWNGVPIGRQKYYSKDGLYNWQIITKPVGSSEMEEFSGSVLLLR